MASDNRLARWLRRLDRLRRVRLIVDSEKRLGSFGATTTLPLLSSSKEEIARSFIFAEPGGGRRFLDVGARDGALTYLLGISGNLEYSEASYLGNLERFRGQYEYYGMDLKSDGAANVLIGDICAEDYVQQHASFAAFFDVVYSNNVFEHLRRPWIAARNILALLKPRGLGIAIAPFAQRYHQSPGDYFRYTHMGMRSLFEDAAPIDVLTCGYDLAGRRNDWQGSGENNDIVPVDRFGAWRETWFTLLIFRKLQ